MNKNIKQLMESLFDEETDNMLASLPIRAILRK